MVVPTNVYPIDYLKDSDEFIFVTAGFILRVDYKKKVFELQTPDKLAYFEDFEILKSPPDWFVTIDFGITEWVRSAVEWNKKKPRPKDQSNYFSFEIENVFYDGRFNPRTNDISLWIPCKTILCKRDSLTTDFPEVQFIDNGRLITLVTNYVVNLHTDSDCEEGRPLNLPIIFNPLKMVIGENTYLFDYLADFDLALLVIPERSIEANLQTIETDVLELAELHQGMLYDVIRSVVYA